MEVSVEHMQKIKNGVHIFQAVLIFVAWIIMIAVFRSTGSQVDGRPGWFFGLCFLTIPAILYQTMTPLFPRSRKFGNPYAFATVDGVYTVLWFSAFVAVAVWNTDGKCGNGCKLSKVDVGLGFFVFVFFGVSTFLSLSGVMYFRRNGTLPGSRIPQNASMIDPDAEAFSTAPNDDEYARVWMHDHDHDHDQDHRPKDDHSAPNYSEMDTSHQDRYENTSYTGEASTYGSIVEGGATSYAGDSGSHYATNYGSEPDYGRTSTPLGMNPSSSYNEGEGTGRAHFPAGNYD